MGMYSSLASIIADNNVSKNIRFVNGDASFIVRFEDLDESTKSEPYILENISKCGVEIGVVQDNSEEVKDFLDKAINEDKDYLSNVWEILRKYRKYLAYHNVIKSWCEKFIDCYLENSEISIRNQMSIEDIGVKESKRHRSIDEYIERQFRCYSNKIKHGFNITDFQKEARFILKELCELMDAIEHNDVENMMEELGDIVIFCYGIAEMAHKDLDDQIFEKMKINEGRVYHRNEFGDFVKDKAEQ